jgi:histidine triad (HIT) family protein
MRSSFAEWRPCIRRVDSPRASQPCRSTLALDPREECLANCVFCDIAGGTRGADNRDVSFRNDGAVAFPNQRQRSENPGHHLVVPTTHVVDLYSLQPPLYSPLMDALVTTARAVRAAFGATGTTIFQHNEHDGGQDVFHLHLHVVPRYAGDGFYEGPGRWPNGLVELDVETLNDQAAAVVAALAR